MEKLIREFRGGGITLGALTDIVGYHLPVDIDLKLSLLGEADVLQRARLLIRELQAAADSQAPPQKFPPTSAPTDRQLNGTGLIIDMPWGFH